jgi:protein-S-isoprenylcysteine O-methyltransferase Ste14
MAETSVDDDRETPGVLAPPPLLFAGGLGAGFLLDALLPLPLPASPPVRAGGAALVAGGVALVGGALAAMRRAHTNVSPYEPTTALVTTGPYRRSRNPIYVAFAMVQAGVALLAGRAWPALMLLPVLLLVRHGVIAREERYLERRLGEPYAEYRARVRRWL